MLRSMKIGKRAAIIFSFVGVLVITMGLTSLYQAKKMDSATDEIRTVWLQGVLALGEIGMDLGSSRALTLRSVILEGESERINTISRINELNKKIKNETQSYEKTVLAPEDRKLFSDFVYQLTEYENYQEKVLKAVIEGREHDQVELVEGPLVARSNSLMVALQELNKFNVNGIVNAANLSKHTFHIALIVNSVSLALILVVLVSVAVLLTRSIVIPLADAVDVAKRVAGGDLAKKIVVHGNDEPANLLTALHEMQTSLRVTIHQIAGSSEQLASASEELNAVTEDSNRGLTQQSLEIDQAAAAINEMTAAVEEVANNAVTTAVASKDAERSTQDGRVRVTEALESIAILTNDVSLSSQEIEQLAKSINDIGGVIDVIRSIADQTNLLALNAAIEAARAGEAGSGFAVVADEVRSLAHRTQQSTIEIESMISSIQSGTLRAVGAMNESQERAATTLEISHAASEAFRVISEAITDINEKNMVIANASEEQAQVAREVDKNLINIRNLSIQTSAGSNQTTAASQELSRLAIELNAMTLKFKV